jgi:hypothetical protein
VTETQTPEAAKVTTLHAALLAAVTELSGYVTKDGFNKDQSYRYAGHEAVLAHTRSALLAHHLALIPTALRHVGVFGYSTRSGEQAAWLWEQSFDLVHAPSGECIALAVQVTTRATEKAAMVASTTADRTMLLRLLRLTTVDDVEEQPDPSRGNNAQRDTKPANVQKPNGQHRETSGAATVIKTLHDELAKQAPDAGTLGKFYRHAREQLRKVNAQDPAWEDFDNAFGKRCNALGLDPYQVAKAGRS